MAKRINNDLQNTTYETKDEQDESHKNPEMNARRPEG